MTRSAKYGFSPLAVYCTQGAVKDLLVTNEGREGRGLPKISLLQWWRDLSSSGGNLAKAQALVAKAASFLPKAESASPTEQSDKVVTALGQLTRIRAKLDLLKPQINKVGKDGKVIISAKEFSAMSNEWHIQMSVIAKGLTVEGQPNLMVSDFFRGSVIKTGGSAFGELATASIVGIAAAVSVVAIAVCYYLSQRQLTARELDVTRRLEMVPAAQRAELIRDTALATGDNPLTPTTGPTFEAKGVGDAAKGITGLIVTGAVLYMGVVYGLPMLNKYMKAKEASA